MRTLTFTLLFFVFSFRVVNAQDQLSLSLNRHDLQQQASYWFAALRQSTSDDILADRLKVYFAADLEDVLTPMQRKAYSRACDTVKEQEPGSNSPKNTVICTALDPSKITGWRLYGNAGKKPATWEEVKAIGILFQKLSGKEAVVFYMRRTDLDTRLRPAMLYLVQTCMLQPEAAKGAESVDISDTLLRLTTDRWYLNTLGTWYTKSRSGMLKCYTTDNLSKPLDTTTVQNIRPVAMAEKMGPDGKAPSANPSPAASFGAGDMLGIYVRMESKLAKGAFTHTFTTASPLYSAIPETANQPMPTPMFYWAMKDAEKACNAKTDWILFQELVYYACIHNSLKK